MRLLSHIASTEEDVHVHLASFEYISFIYKSGIQWQICSWMDWQLYGQSVHQIFNRLATMLDNWKSQKLGSKQ